MARLAAVRRSLDRGRDFFRLRTYFKSDSPFLSSYRLTLIAKQTAIVGMAALGMTVIIISGGIDLSVGSIMALAAVSLAALFRDDANPLLATFLVMSGRRSGGNIQRRDRHRTAAGPVHRHPGDDAGISRPGRANRSSGQDRTWRCAELVGQLARSARQGKPSADGHGATGSWCYWASCWRRHALHRVRPACVCDRLERSDRPTVRSERAANKDSRLCTGRTFHGGSRTVQLQRTEKSGRSEAGSGWSWTSSRPW